MKLSQKLPLMFATAIGLLFAASLFGIFKLNNAIGVYRDQVMRSVEYSSIVGTVEADLLTGLQEWKNVLIRGKNEKSRDDFWDAHVKKMTSVKTKLQALNGVITDTQQKNTIEKLITQIDIVNDKFNKAYEGFKAANNEVAVGDKLSLGITREPSKVLDELKALMLENEKNLSEQASSSAELASQIAYGLLAGVSILVITVSIIFSRRIVTRLNIAVNVSQAVAAGDLTTPVQNTGKDEISDLFRALKNMQDELAEIVTQVRSSSENLATASAEISQANIDLSSRTETQASSLEETSASLEELTASFGSTADNTNTATQVAVSASTVAQQGGEIVAKVVQTMEGISESSNKIADIISIIDGIAFQTNILALNAAVEAARAGEQGRGFAVVASEVRALAGRSADAAKEIKDLILTSVERMKEGNALVDSAGSTMNKVISSIGQVAQTMGEISRATSEQNANASQISEAVNSIDQTTQQNAALVEQVAASSTNLKELAQNLVATVSVFKLQA